VLAEQAGDDSKAQATVSPHDKGHSILRDSPVYLVSHLSHDVDDKRQVPLSRMVGIRAEEHRRQVSEICDI
jgi:hypothetical protein